MHEHQPKLVNVRLSEDEPANLTITKTKSILSPRVAWSLNGNAAAHRSALKKCLAFEYQSSFTVSYLIYGLLYPVWVVSFIDIPN